MGLVYDLEKFGIESESGFAGFFQSSKYAGITLSALIVYVAWYTTRQKKIFLKALNYIIILFGFYLVYKTYARTAYVMSIAGFILIFYKFLNIRKLIPYMILGILLSFLFYSWYQNDMALRLRLRGQTIHKAEEDINIDNITSGRTIFIQVNLESWMESNFISKILGMGVGKSEELMYEKIGLKKVSHNGFVDYLVYSGIVGLLLFLYFLIIIYKYIKKSRELKILVNAFFIIFIILNLFQGGDFFFFSVFMAMIFALPIIYRRKSICETY